MTNKSSKTKAPAKAAAKPTSTSSAEQITVTQGLKELKLLEKRIDRGVAELEVIRARPNNQPAPGGVNVETFTRNAQSGFDSVMALIKRRSLIKGALITSNAVTHINVPGYGNVSVATALEIRRGQSHELQLVNRITAQIKAAEAQHNRLEQAVQASINEQRKTLTTVTAEVLATVEASARDTAGPVMDDPLNARERLQELNQDAEMLNMQIDAALEISNATTLITL